MRQISFAAAVLVALSGCQSIPKNTADPMQVVSTSTPVADPSASANNEVTTEGLPASADAGATHTPEVDVVLTPADVAGAQSNADLWWRIRQQLVLPVPENEQVVTQREWYERNQEYMDRMAERATRYLHHIANTIEARGLPMDLALLPVVESAFQPYAYSRSRAAGIWQFIPGTGKLYGLKQNWWQDDRRDIVRATDAALDYLTKLNRQFDGDWQLALAAYNSGEGNVSRAIEKNKRKGKPTDFWSLDLPRETRAYVPKLLALVQLLRESDRFALKWQSIPDAPYFARVKVDTQIDIALAAELAGISEDELYQLNPGYTRWATAPDNGVELLLPLAAAERFQAELEKIPVEDRVKWAHYTVQKGDTLSGIAKNFRTSAEQLRSINKLGSNSLKLHQELLIPKAGNSAGVPPSVVAHLSSREKFELARDAGAVGGVHVVRSGDTLWSISRKYRVTLAALLDFNQLTKNSAIHSGQRLRVPGIAADKSAVVSTMATRRVRYTVRSGDSLARISEKFGVSIDDVARWNGWSKSRLLKAGQKLTIYPASANGG